MVTRTFLACLGLAALALAEAAAPASADAGPARPEAGAAADAGPPSAESVAARLAFELPSVSALPAAASALAAGDFDGDGDPDVLTLGVDGLVSLALNVGGGRFSASTLELDPLDVFDEAPYVGMRTGDVDGDGILDVFVYGVDDPGSALGGCSATLLRGVGGGAFEAAGSFAATPPEPIDWSRGCTGLELGDFNGDGWLDLALAHAYAPFETFNGLNGAFSVYLGQGDGALAPAGDYPLTHDIGPFVSYAMSSGDFDGDGLTDLTFVAEIRWLSGPAAARLETFRGDGAGGFSSSVIHDFECDFCDLMVARAADFTGDGRPDVVIASELPDFPAAYPVLLLANGGAGSFEPPTLIAESINPSSLETEDFTGDGLIDLVIVSAPDSVTLLPGDGAGGFGAAQRFFGSGSAVASAAADVDGDGDDDLVLLDPQAPALRVAHNELPGGGLSLPKLTRLPEPGAEHVLTAADFDRDGRTDLLAASAEQLQVMLSTADGRFVGGASAPSWAYPAAVPVADLDADGWLDLVVPAEAGFVALLGEPGGSFGGALAPPSGHRPREVTSSNLGDLDGDGDLDLAAHELGSDTIELYANDGSQRFVPWQTLPWPAMSPAASISTLYLADVTGDGSLDLFAGADDRFDDSGARAPGATALWPGDGRGGFGPSLAVDISGRRLLIEDVDRDGRLDVIGPRRLLLGEGGGRFAPPLPLEDLAPSELAVADMDGDGRLDLIAISDRGVSVALAEGAGRFAPHQSLLPWGATYWSALITADVAGSPAPDLVVVRNSYDEDGYIAELAVLENARAPGCAEPQPGRSARRVASGLR